MTDTNGSKPKRQRNTTELPIGIAITKLRELEEDRLEAHRKVDADYGGRGQKILYRIPVEFHAHVVDKSGWSVTADGEPSRSDDVQSDVNAGTASTASDPEELPAGARPIDPKRAENIKRMTGQGRT